MKMKQNWDFRLEVTRKFKFYLVALFIANLIAFIVAAYDFPFFENLKPILHDFMSFDLESPNFQVAATQVVCINALFIELGFVALAALIMEE